MKICHLHLTDPFGNKQTLICQLKNGSINYVYYSGWMDSGIPYALSNLQCVLPIEKIDDTETKEQFTQRIIDIINNKSVVRVAKQVSTEVTF
jgi:hypothetical protein